MTNKIVSSSRVSGDPVPPVEKKGKYSCCLCNPLVAFALKVGRAVRLFFSMVCSWLGFSKKIYEPEIPEQPLLKRRARRAPRPAPGPSPYSAPLSPASSHDPFSATNSSAPPHTKPLPPFPEPARMCPTEIGPAVVYNADGNTCFLTTTSHVLMNDPNIRAAIDYLSSNPPSSSLSQNECNALDLVIIFFQGYKNNNLPHDQAKILRRALYFLNSGVFVNEDQGQHDANEAFRLIRNLIVDALPDGQKLKLFPYISQQTIATVVPSDQLIQEAQTENNCNPNINIQKYTSLNAQESGVLDVARGIFKQGPALPYGELIEIPIQPHLQFPALIESYFFEDCRGLAPSDRLVDKQNGYGQLKKFAQNSKTIQLNTAPPQLIITLKRFVYTTGHLRKINDRVSGIDHQITLSETHFQDKKKATFRLDSVMLHQGSGVHFGHYTTLMRKIDENTGTHYYMHCDDDGVVSPLNPTQFLAEAGNRGYLFFYTKIS